LCTPASDMRVEVPSSSQKLRLPMIRSQETNETTGYQTWQILNVMLQSYYTSYRWLTA